MVKTTVYCDRCKAPVHRDDRTELVTESWVGPSQERRESIDLCAPCSNELVAWLNAAALTHPPLRRSAG